MRSRRLTRQHLVPRGTDLVSVARDTCGIHAQVQASAELQLAARVEGIVRADVRRALWADRSLVKAWTVRGTLHLHPADELPLWYAALRAAAPSERRGLDAWVDPHGTVHPALTAAHVGEIRAAVLDALDGRCLLREDLAAAVAGRVSPKARDRLRSGFAFFGGAELCQGPPQGNRITLARSDQWIKRSKKVAPKKALLEVCKRFVGTYGPVAPSAFSEWFSTGLTPDAARSLFASLELEEVSVEGHPAFVLAGDTRFPRATAELRLLSEYDVYVMGFRERDHLVPLRVREQVAAHAKGRYEGPAGVRFLNIGGMAVGLWERAKRGQRIEIRVDPSRRLTRAERAELGHEADRIGSFLGLDPALTVA